MGRGQLGDNSCPCHLQDNVDNEKVKKVVDDVSKNSDQQVDFREYALVLAEGAVLFLRPVLKQSTSLLPWISWLIQLSIF